MKPNPQFVPNFRRFCTVPLEYVKLKVELGVEVRRTSTNRLAVLILKTLRATETGSFLKVAITKTITRSFTLNRRAKP